LRRLLFYVLLCTCFIVTITHADSYDLRNVDGTSYVTPVKNQGSYGTCWCFGTMASIESSILMQGNWLGLGTVPDLSENNLNNGVGFYPIPVDQGGDYRMSAAYLTRGSGPVYESDDPYHNTSTPIDQPVHYYVRDIEWYNAGQDLSNIGEVKNALTTYGAVSTCIYWYGIYFNASKGSYYQPAADTNLPNHSVTIVGWDDAKVTQAPQPGAWLCKNSWGSTWNGDGYFWVSYYDKHAAKDPEMGAVSFHNVVPAFQQRIYGHDDHGWCAEKDYAYAMNAYNAAEAGQLAAVGFYTVEPDVEYVIRIFSTLENGTTSGLLAEKSGSYDAAGYHTLDLDAPISVANGEAFYVSLYVNNGSQAVDMTVMKNVLLAGETTYSGYLVESEANAGESFYSVDGSLWADLYDVQSDHSANWCIKVLTLPEIGDCNNDHLIDGVDLAMWQQHDDPLGLNENTFAMGDWIVDGRIDGADLALWQQNYRPIGVAETVPEPGTLMLMLCGAAWLGGVRRKKRM